MTDLAQFLLERIADDEIHAGIMWSGRREMRWQWSTHGYSGAPTVEIAGTGQTPAPVVAHVQIDHAHEHIARWDPARVLAECEAKRRIVNRYADEAAPALDWTYTQRLSLTDVQYATAQIAAHTLRDLAVPYADHPDYREEWRP